MQIQVQGFDSFRGLYCDDPDFREVWSKCDNGLFHQFSKLGGYLFNSARLKIMKFHGVPKTLTSDRDINLIGDNAKQWDLILPQADFAYNRSVNHTTHKSPFEVVYGQNPITLLDLVTVPGVVQFTEEGANHSEHIKELHRSEGNLVWIHLRKERFSAGRFGKLKPRGDGPFRVLKNINDNAYKIERHGHYNVSATFNVADLSAYKGDSDDEPDSGSSLFQEREDDADAGNERVNMTNTFGAYFEATNFCVGLG
uniref:Tf2-1-like SH3-like domain-containing protein n=1 Tax=Tanacetum cinerariifolium TaxID=118510 RepID=A0A6L2JGV2_TANCI|nr:hypothetical protein [Tanacetum cinerariifolium]